MARFRQALLFCPIVDLTRDQHEELLADYGFIRCQQSHIINKAYIKSWVKDMGGYILMTDNKQVPISRNKKDILKRLLLA